MSTANTTPSHVPIDEETLSKFNREKIKEQLRIRCQKLSGNKQEMLYRPRKALEEKTPVAGARKSQPKKKKSKARINGEKGMGVFPPTAFWEISNPE